MTSPTQKKRICVGKITTPHGVKGLVKIRPYCEDTSLLNGTLFISEEGTQTLNISLKNPTAKHILAAIEGIDSPEEAKKHKHSLYVSREDLPEIKSENEFYIEDLIGLTAQTHDHNDILGTIITVENFGAGDLLEIKPQDGSPPYYIPFHDDYITKIDLEDKTVMLQNTAIFKMD